MSTSPTRLPSLRRPAGKTRPLSMIERPLSNLPSLASDTSENEPSKKTNRRSLLAQFSRKASASAKDAGGTKEEGEEHDSGSSRPSDDTRTSNESSGRRALEEERQMLPPSKLSRPISMIPPRGSSSKISKTRSQLSAATTTTTKETDSNLETARAESLAALQGTAPATTLKPAIQNSELTRAGSTRLPQAPRPAGPAIPSRTTSAKEKGSQSPKSKTANGIQTGAVITITEERTSPSKPRPASVYTPTTNQTSNDSSTLTSQRSPPRTANTQPPQKISPPRASVPSRPRPTSQMVAPVSKPPFNTYQQHYSPAKSSLPKPPVPAARHSSKLSTTTATTTPTTATATTTTTTPEEDIPPITETTKLQIELLQLSLLHQSSAKCTQDYTTSAKRKLSKKHSKLRKDYENLRAQELVHQRTANLAALDSWCEDPGMLVENLQILSLVYSDLTALMEEGGKHADVVSVFESWMGEVEHPSPQEEEDRAFIEPLSDAWKAAHASVLLKLRSIQRNLRVLPPAPRSEELLSGVRIVFEACKSLVEDMVRELEVMEKVEKEVMAREVMRVDVDVNALVMGDAGMKEEVWAPPWRQNVG